MSASWVVDPCPSCTFQCRIRFMGIPGEDNHAPNREQARYKLPMVVLAKLVAIRPSNPRLRHIRRIEKEQRVWTIESGYHATPITKFNLDILEAVMDGG
jgi:hypothetical protein